MQPKVIEMNKAIKKVMIISATIFAGCSTIVSGKFKVFMCPPNAMGNK